MKLLRGVAGHLPHHLWVQFSSIARRTQLEQALGATGQRLFKRACCLWGHLYSYFCWGRIRLASRHRVKSLRWGELLVLSRWLTERVSTCRWVPLS